MPTPSIANSVALLVEARRTLGLSQGSLGELLGTSRRTGQRWETTGTKPSGDQWMKLAGHVQPHDPDLAAQIAAHAGGSLSPLAPSAAPITQGNPAGRAAPLPPEVVDSIVCAAAESMNVTPAAIRPALLAAFSRAQKIGLTVEEVTRVLTPVVESQGTGRSAS